MEQEGLSNVEQERQPSLENIEPKSTKQPGADESVDGMDVDITEKAIIIPKTTGKDNSIAPPAVKRKRGRKPGVKNSNKENENSSNITKGSKRKRKQDGYNEEGNEEQILKEPKPKRARKSVAKKQPLQRAPLTPPLGPSPVSVKDLAAAKAETARDDRLKKIPFYREEIKEIFDYLCDRNVYWRNDLPKNKKFSNRDTRLLEKEVRKRVADILAGYPPEKEVMDAFEVEEERLKSLGGDTTGAEMEVENITGSEGGSKEDAEGEKAPVSMDFGSQIEAMSLDC
ncbi:hypothetical protein TWF694_002631 [Orbilia ellipsospora]|uniref:Uncharacterized protein n=1 Tax=Orbilia ellipsospora TaxID=2528407 RepID=A0AAV9X2L6_9PEZI